MSELSANLLVPRAPQVNLIPPEVASRKAAGRQRGALIAGFMVFLLVLGGATLFVKAQERRAEAALQAEVDRGTALQAEAAKYAEVPKMKQQTANAESAAQYAGATEIRWVDFFNLVAGGIPAAISLNSWTLGVDSPQTASAPSTDPFATADIGVLAFSGTSPTYPDVAALERSLDAVQGFHNTSIPDVTRNEVDKVVTFEFSGTTRVTAEAFDQRFTEGAAQKLIRTRAILDLMAREADAQTRVTAARAALDAGVKGASESLAAALATYNTAAKESQSFLDLLTAYTDTQAAVTKAQSAVDAGTKGADAALVAAKSVADTVATAMDNLSSAVAQRANAQKGVDAIANRIIAAHYLIAAKQAALDAANVAANSAAAAGTPISSQGVAYAAQLVSEAQDVLAKEEKPLGAAMALVDDAQGVVDAAIAAVPAALSAAQESAGKAN